MQPLAVVHDGFGAEPRLITVHLGRFVVRMSSVRRAAGTMKEGAELAAALLLSQPRITGTGSSQKFDNPWPDWEVHCREPLLYCSILTCRLIDLPEYRREH